MDTLEFTCPECGHSAEVEVKTWEMEFRSNTAYESVSCPACLKELELEVMAEPVYTYTVQSVALA
jgi:transcription elongation factor Elf1